MKKFLYLGVFLAACTSSESLDNLSDNATLFSNVNIINVRDGNIISGKDVLIDSTKIIRIYDHENDPKGIAQIIDATGKYMLPGLAEMHAHIPPPEAGDEYIEQVLFLYLANGITTIRGMLGNPYHLELRERAKRNELLSPRIFTSSPSFNGNTVKTPEEAREKVTNYANEGYDFLKIHPGVKLDVFEELVNTANEVDITFAGHVPVAVGIRRAISSGYASIDHVDGFLEGLVPATANVNPNENGFFGYNFTSLSDTSLIDELVDMTAQNKVWVVPTQSLFDRWFSPIDGQTYASESEMKYLPKSTIEDWVENKNQLISGENYNNEQWQKFNDIRMLLISALHQNGYGLLLGSDAPQVFNVPGFSIHHELAAMIEAGLSPLESLQIGTLNPAIYFNQEGKFGEILEDSSADFLLLNENPLNDLEKLKNLHGVMVRGQWLSKEEIDNKLAEIAASAIKQ